MNSVVSQYFSGEWQYVFIMFTLRVTGAKNQTFASIKCLRTVNEPVSIMVITDRLFMISSCVSSGVSALCHLGLFFISFSPAASHSFKFLPLCSFSSAKLLLPPTNIRTVDLEPNFVWQLSDNQRRLFTQTAVQTSVADLCSGLMTGSLCNYNQ